MQRERDGAILGYMAIRCLIVDDSARFLQAARGLLEREGVQVVGVASTGEQARRQMSELRPDIMLVDIDLGTESGFEVARRLSVLPTDNQPADQPRIILISSHDEEDFQDLIASSPVIGFLGKSLLSADAIQQLLGRSGGHPYGSKL